MNWNQCTFLLSLRRDFLRPANQLLRRSVWVRKKGPGGTVPSNERVRPSLVRAPGLDAAVDTVDTAAEAGLEAVSGRTGFFWKRLIISSRLSMASLAADLADSLRLFRNVSAFTAGGRHSNHRIGSFAPVTFPLESYIKLSSATL